MPGDVGDPGMSVLAYARRMGLASVPALEMARDWSQTTNQNTGQFSLEQEAGDSLEQEAGDYSGYTLALIGALPWSGHNELDLAIARVQSSLGPSFYEAYHEVLPRTPLHEFRQRLYMVYVLLEYYLRDGAEVRGTLLKLAKGCVRFAKQRMDGDQLFSYGHMSAAKTSLVNTRRPSTSHR
eukprot:INCI14779.3.p1 GENE.INCI14779.3~~INCI14779.3.p1  ORF type:complete len:181 (+),score=14.78 INCI14779.3:84-626(+)